MSVGTEKNRMRAGRLLALSAAVGGVSLFTAINAQGAATPVTWTGTGTTDFELGTNWTGGAPADDLTTNIASFTNVSPTVQPELTKDRSVAGLSFGDGVNLQSGLTLGGDFTLSVGGSGVSVLNPGTGSNSIADTISANVNVAANQTWTTTRITLHMTGVLGGSSKLTKSGSSYLYLEGNAPANTYNGLLDVTNGRVYLNKTNGPALAGDIVVESSDNSLLMWEADNQVADTSNITISRGNLRLANSLTNKGISDTFNNLNVSGGIVYTDKITSLTGTTDATVINNDTSVTGDGITHGVLNVSGGTQWTMHSLAVSGGGVVNRIGTSYSDDTQRALTVGAGGLAITNQASGAYTPILLGSSLANNAVNKLVLQGDVTFNGTSGNANTTTIAADTTEAQLGTIELNGTRTFTINDGDAAVDLRIEPAINDNGVNVGGLTKAGMGTLELAGNNGYTGATTISGGTLKLASADRIADASSMTLNGGTLDTAGFNETLNTLALLANSTIDLGDGASVLHFADSSGVNWTGSTLLTIANWSGSSTDQLFFGNSNTALTSGQVAQIQFLNPEGFAPGVYSASILPTGEIVTAVPEPATGLVLLGLGAMGLMGRRRKHA